MTPWACGRLCRLRAGIQENMHDEKGEKHGLHGEDHRPQGPEKGPEGPGRQAGGGGQAGRCHQPWPTRWRPSTSQIAGLEALAKASREGADPVYDGVLHDGEGKPRDGGKDAPKPFATLGEQLKAIY